MGNVPVYGPQDNSGAYRIRDGTGKDGSILLCNKCFDRMSVEYELIRLPEEQDMCSCGAFVPQDYGCNGCWNPDVANCPAHLKHVLIKPTLSPTSTSTKC